MRWSLARTSASSWSESVAARSFSDAAWRVPCASSVCASAFARQARLLDLRQGRLAERVVELLLRRRELPAEGRRSARSACATRRPAGPAACAGSRRAWRRVPGACLGAARDLVAQVARLALGIGMRPAAAAARSTGRWRRGARAGPASTIRKTSARLSQRGRARPARAPRRLSAAGDAPPPAQRSARSKPTWTTQREHRRRHRAGEHDACCR